MYDMKKIYALALLALLAACNTTESFDTGMSKIHILKGSVELDGFTWNKSAVVGLYSADIGSVGNVECRIENWQRSSPSAGSIEGSFEASGISPAGGRQEYLVYAPYSRETIYSPSQRRMFDFRISNVQTQTAPGEFPVPPSLALTKASFSGDENLEFSLKPISSVIEVSIASREYKDYTISRLVLSDDSKETALAGKFDFSIDSLVMYRSSGFSTITNNITKPDSLRNGESQKFWFNVIPGDYSEKTFSLTITLSKGSTSVSLPINLPGTLCEKGKVASFAVADLKTADNKVGPWFCPFESRNLPGPGYAYGDANTYLIQSKTAVYAGGTLSPNPDIPDEVEIDYRLRGNYVNGEAPEGVTFEWAQAAGGMWVPRNDGKFVSNQFTIQVDAANYKVKVKNTGSTAGAPILLMKKGGRILWGWSFWNISADGTTMDPVNIGGYDFAPLDLGIHTGKFGDYIQGAAAGHMSRSAYYYQWGRYLPVFWNSFLSVQWSHSAEGQEEVSGAGNVLGMNGPYKTVGEALGHPAGVILHVGTEDMPKWTDEDISTLWGCLPADEPGKGVKSIYDPCPKGWRVPDYDAAKALVAAAGEDPVYSMDAGQLGINIGATRFLYLGYFEAYKALATSGTRFTGGGIAGTSGSGYPCYFWANCMPAEKSNTAYAFRYYHNQTGKAPSVTAFTSSTLATVRCMKDDDNR